MDIESGIGNVTDDLLRFNVVDGKLVCSGHIDVETTLDIYNMGGVIVSSATVEPGIECATLDIAGLPHGSYIVVVKNVNGMAVYKILL